MSAPTAAASGSGGLASAARYLPEGQVKLILSQIYLGLLAFGIGILAGLAQALDRMLPADSTIWHYFPFQENYYQGLTMHGVILALVFTFAFSNGFMPLVASKSLGRRLDGRLLWATAILSYVGVLLAGMEIIRNTSSVLFTMYPPLQATPIYYLGAACLVLSTWTAFGSILVAYRSWRRDNPDDRIPLAGFTVLASYAMWWLASLGVVVEVVFMLLPWSLGIVPETDPQLARTLFWFTGHPIVYFWLLPAYVSWYLMIPKQVGGKLFSDPLTRLVFVMFLLVSIPTGFHHQYTDPGISAALKKVHLIGTFAVFFPSMLTAFSVMAALESGGRARGGRGLLGWIPKLPWGNPSVAAQLLAMLAFMLGGVSGLINASYNVNLVIHNSAWVPGHFHLTVGTAVALTFIGISYWLIPHLTGRSLWGRRMAVAQAWLWFIGVLIFSRGQVEGGLAGLPRRLNISNLAYDLPEWELSHAMTGIGGSIMFISGMLFFVVILGTLFLGERDTQVEMPTAEVIAGPETGWAVLDRWNVWVPTAVLLILLAYGPYFLQYTPNFVAEGWKLWGGPQ